MDCASWASWLRKLRNLFEGKISGGCLRAGTYTLVTGSKTVGGNLMENHFGFQFRGDPANHANIERTRSVTDTAKAWATADGCDMEPTITRLPDVAHEGTAVK